MKMIQKDGNSTMGNQEDFDLFDVERKINRIRFILSLLFFAIGYSSMKSHSVPGVYVTIYIMSAIYLSGALVWEILFRFIRYSPSLKYLTTALDMFVAIGIKFGFHYDSINGWGMALKEPGSFLVFFLFIAASGLRLDATFTMIVGIVSAVGYVVLMGMAVQSGSMSFIDDPSRFLDPAVLRLPTEIAKIAFLIAVAGIIAYMARLLKRFMGSLMDSRQRSDENILLLRQTMETTSTVLENLNHISHTLKENTLVLKNILDEQDAFFKKDADGIRILVGEGSEVSRIASEQKERISDVTRRFEEVHKNLISIMQGSLQAMERAKHVRNMTEESKKTMGLTVEVVNQMRAQSADIAQITESINAIASQTNLLSLNAAIEAARAGEQGRGFAVVADEVARLADQSIHSSRNIEAIINDTVKHIEAISDLLESAAKSLESVSGASGANFLFLEQIAGQIQTQEQQSDHIRNHLNTLNQIASSIDDVTGTQKDYLGDFEARNLSKIELTGSTVRIAEELQQLAHRLVEASDSLKSVLGSTGESHS